MEEGEARICDATCHDICDAVCAPSVAPSVCLADENVSVMFAGVGGAAMPRGVSLGGGEVRRSTAQDAGWPKRKSAPEARRGERPVGSIGCGGGCARLLAHWNARGGDWVAVAPTSAHDSLAVYLAVSLAVS